MLIEYVKFDVPEVQKALKSGIQTSDGTTIDKGYFRNLIEQCRDLQINTFIRDRDNGEWVQTIRKKYARENYDITTRNYIFYEILEEIGEEVGGWGIPSSSGNINHPEAEFIYARIYAPLKSPNKIAVFLVWLWRDHTDVAIKFYEDLQLYDLVEKHQQRIARENQEPAPQPALIEKPPESIKDERIFTEDEWLNPENPHGIHFEGRKAETQKLDDFANSDGLFRIWCIKGASGAGKTRLKAEWIRNSSFLKGWNKEILTNTDRKNKDWSSWNPTCPSLIVIDCLFDFGDEIQEIIKRCKRELTVKVRLLIIAHVFPSELRDLIHERNWGFLGMDGQKFDEIKKLFFEEKPLDLTATSDQDTIIGSIIHQVAGVDTDKKLVEEAKNFLRCGLKNAWYPLFAALIGDALKNKKDYRTWNRHDLIYYYLEGHDRLPWLQKDKDGIWASAFIAAATALRGANFSLLCECIPEHQMESLQSYAKIKDICCQIVSVDDKNRLHSFEPDIMGESFFLLFLRTLPDFPSLLKKQFIQMLSGGDSGMQMMNSWNFIGFIESLVRNLCNEDQKDAGAQRNWDALLNFLNPQDFPLESSMRWGVCASLIECADLIRKFHSQVRAEEYSRALRQVDENTIKKVVLSKAEPSSSEYLIRYLDHRSEDITIKTLGDVFTEEVLYEYMNCTPLMLACELGCDRVFSALIKANPDVNQADYSTGETALMFSSRRSERMTEALLLAGADPNLEEKYWRYTALTFACFRGTEAIVRALLKGGADPYHRDCDGMTALMHACKRGSKEIVQTLLEKMDGDCNQVSIDGLTALSIVRYFRFEKIESLLIKAGANADLTDTFDATYLGILMGQDYFPWGIRIALKEASKHNFQGFILKCYDPFDYSFDMANDEDSSYYVYYEDVNAVAKSLDLYGTHIYEVKEIIKPKKRFRFNGEVEIKKWLTDRDIAYKVTSGGGIILSNSKKTKK